MRPIIYDKAARHRKSKSYKSNIAVHPFVIFAVAAAVAIVLFGVLAYFFWYVQ